MSDVVLFGGTTEGRELADHCGRAGIHTLVCVATPLGQAEGATWPSVRYRVGRLGPGDLTDVLRTVHPQVVVDATHPYASTITAHVARATAALGIPLIRVARSGAVVPDGIDRVLRFGDLEALIDWLNTTSGVVFAATGAQGAPALTRVTEFADRVYLRLLPVSEGLAQCAALGYPAAHLIAMKGPFSADLNAAMFRHTNASILVTKDSGAAGGLVEKLRAAATCGLTVAIVERPTDQPGMSLEDACRLIAKALA
jgi:precorrin-6x reductase